MGSRKAADRFYVVSPAHARTEIDLFVEAPVDFTKAQGSAIWKEVGAGLAAPFMGLDDLLAMKRQAGRLKDMLDIEQLNKLGETPNE
jgi:hypothetical protein